MAAVLFALLLPPAAAALAMHAFWPVPSKVLPPAPFASNTAAPVEDRTPEIRGKILDANGNPVPSAAVRLVSPVAPYKVLRDATSDLAGAFSFAHVGKESFTVAADHDPEGFVTSAVVRVDEGHSEDVTLVLSSTNGVRGTVVDGDDHPVAGATLSIAGAPWKVPSATTDDAGTFHLIVVPDQASSLVAVARGYKTAYTELARRGKPEDLVVRIRLAAALPVEGDVYGVDGEPVRADVVACAGQAAEARTTSKEDGTFELPASTLGCEAVAELAGFASSDPVAMVEGTRARLRLRTGGAIEGVVVDDHGTGVPSFALGIESYVSPRAGGLDRGPRPFADVRGAFLWEKLAPGSYVLVASVRGRPPARSESIDVKSGATTRGVRIVVAPGGTVMGRISDERHAGIADVDVGFDVVSSVVDGTASAKTDASGRFRIEGAPAGPFTLRARKTGFRAKLVSGLRVGSGATLTADMTLAAVDGGAGLELGGIGANLTMTHEGIFLAGVGADDPAGRAGLQVGDRILLIDGENSDGMSVADAIQRLRGEAGTTVGVSVERPGSGQRLDVMIVRGNIVR